LILAVAGGLFAQELTWSGSLKTGLRATYTDDGSDGVYEWGPYSNDADSVVPEFKLNGDYTNGDVGLHFQFKLSDGIQNDEIPGYAYASLRAFNILDVYAGYVDNGAWNTMGDNDDDVGEGLGVLLQVVPIEGLNLGVGIYDAEYSSLSPSNNHAHAKYSFGAAYEFPDIIKVALSGALTSPAAEDGVTFTDLAAGVSVLAVPKLKLVFEGYSSTLNADDIGWTIDEVAEYDLGAIDVGLTAWQYLNQEGVISAEDFGASGLPDTSSEYGLGWKFNPWVSYTLGSIVPKLGITIGGQSYGKKLGLPDDISGLLIGAKPSVKINVAENAAIEFAYAFDRYSVDVDNVDPIIKHTAYVDFLWSF
jgi:hypothetical protein